MATNPEFVFLQVPDVLYKNMNGTLSIMNERLSWITEDHETLAVSHRFADIKMQKISVKGKFKVVLHNGNSCAFYFVNRFGQQAMLADLEQVKKLLPQLMSDFKRKNDKELQEKYRILSENPHLLLIYKDLVVEQVISTEEFWSGYVVRTQDSGVSAGILAGDCNASNSGNAERKTMIKKSFDEHSIMLFKTCEAVNATSAGVGPVPSATAGPVPSATAGPVPSATAGKGKDDIGKNATAAVNGNFKPFANYHPTSSQNPARLQRDRLIEMIFSEDADDEPQVKSEDADDEPQVESDDEMDAAKEETDPFTELENLKSYVHEPVPISGIDMREESRSMEEVQQALIEETKSWMQRKPHTMILNPKAAMDALSEFSPGGGDQEQSVAEEPVQSTLKKDMRVKVSLLAEYHNDYWSKSQQRSPDLKAEAPGTQH